MAVRTTYTSSISVPVYGSWKCEHCGEVNSAQGVIVCASSETTSSLRSSKLEETKKKAANNVNNTWAKYALGIINNPKGNYFALHDSLKFENSNCTKCKKKNKWGISTKILNCGYAFFFPAIISLITAIIMGTSGVAWLVFVILFVLSAGPICGDYIYMGKLERLPKEYFPVLGTMNPELIKFATNIGISILDPVKCLAIVKQYNCDGLRQTSLRENANNILTEAKKSKVLIKKIKKYDLDYILARQDETSSRFTGYPGDMKVYHDISLHKWRLYVQLDKESYYFLSVFINENGSFDKYFLDYEAANDSHYEFESDEAIINNLYEEGDDNRYLHELMIRYVENNGAAGLYKLIESSVTNRFFY